MGDQELQALRHAFGLLASFETDSWPDWNGPADSDALRERVKTLAVLLDLIPRHELNRLDEVTRRWKSEFPDCEHIQFNALRTSARSQLRLDLSEPTRAEHQVRATCLASLIRSEADKSPPNNSETVTDLEAQSACAAGLKAWFDVIGDTTTQRWTHLPSAVPGEPPAPIDEIYVDLFAIPQREREQFSQLEPQRNRRAVRRATADAVIGIDTVAARTLNRSVIVGEPGSGKSTAVHWLVWAAYWERLRDFDVAVVVRLSEYAEILGKLPELSPLEYFFESNRLASDEAHAASVGLRRISAKNQRVLLLFDGWDEVPLSLRDEVKSRLLSEAAHFITIITSRPSGLPYELLSDSQQVPFYEVAGLAPRTIRQLTTNTLSLIGKEELMEGLIQRFERESDLREMAANPFLLSLLVRVLAQGDSSHSPLTRADLYFQLIDWIGEQQRRNAMSEPSLNSNHMQILNRLAYEMLFDSEHPGYLFRRDDLSCLSSPAELDEGPIWSSRITTRVDPREDRYTFIHATVQEFLAAAHFKIFQGDLLFEELDRTFHSASRFIVLEFVAGMGGRLSGQCQSRASEWLSMPDRFHEVTRRVAQLAIAGRWNRDSSQGIFEKLQRALWRSAITPNESSAPRRSMELLAELNEEYLVDRLEQLPEVPKHVTDAFIDVVSSSGSRNGMLREYVRERRPTMVLESIVASIKRADLEQNRRTLLDPMIDEVERVIAIEAAGANRDEKAVSILIGMIDLAQATRSTTYAAIHHVASASLGKIGNGIAVGRLVESVVSAESPAHQNDAARALRGTNLSSLDTIGRDRLIQHLASVPPEAETIAAAITALQGQPIREGATVIAELAAMPNALARDRVSAISVLSLAVDDNLVKDFALFLQKEPDKKVYLALLRMIKKRQIPVPLEWLESRFQTTTDRSELNVILETYGRIAISSSKRRRQAAIFVSKLVSDSLRGSATQKRELEQQSSAIRQVLAHDENWRDLIDAPTVALALDIVGLFGETPCTTTTLYLAMQVLGTARPVQAGIVVTKALDAAIKKMHENPTDTLSTSQAEELARLLSNVEPGRLLNYQHDIEPVHSALRTLAEKNGWLIFDTEILDAEGRPVSSAHEDSVECIEETNEGSPTFEQLLTPGQFADLKIYLLMVQSDGPCSPSDSLQKIYDTIQRHLEQGEDHDLVTNLQSCLTNKRTELNFENWRAGIFRARKRVSEVPSLEMILVNHGLDPIA